MTDKTAMCTAIRKFINSRPGFDPRDYGREVQALRADQRSATKDRAHALRLLEAIESRDTITAADLLKPSNNAGRFTVEQQGEKIRIDYTVGQYYATEHRAGAARYLASIFWDYLSEHATPPNATGHDIRKAAALALGRPIAARFYN
jgi:hypothetical protein